MEGRLSSVCCWRGARSEAPRGSLTTQQPNEQPATMLRGLWVLALAAILQSLSFAFTPTTTLSTMNPNHMLQSRSMTTRSAKKLHYSYYSLNDVASLNVQHLPISLVDSTTTLSSLLLTELSSLSSSPLLSVEGELFTTNNIKIAFSIATFFPQLPWLLLILLPTTKITKRLLGGYEIITICCLIHFFIVIASILQPDGTAPIAEFADVFDPINGDPQGAMISMMNYPNFVTEEWSHVLTWDLFVGRYIWLDGLQRGVFTSHSVLLCNLIGPPGLLLHWLTAWIVTGKGPLPDNETEDPGIEDVVEP